jgi:preprotein translocase subunit SecD
MNGQLVRRAAVAVGAVVIAGCTQSTSSNTPKSASATILLRPKTSLTAQELSASATAMRHRLAASRLTGQVSVSNGGVAIATSPRSVRRVEALLEPAGVFRIRRVLAVARASSTGPASGQTGRGGVLSLRTLDQAQAMFAGYRCTDGLATDDPSDYYLACDQSGNAYLLAPAELQGTDIDRVTAGRPPNSISASGEWEVDLAFTSRAQTTWARLTAQVTRLPDVPSCGPPAGCNAVALLYDGVVEAAPRIGEAILSGPAQITGNFTENQATDLAAVLGAPLRTAFTLAPTAG